MKGGLVHHVLYIHVCSMEVCFLPFCLSLHGEREEKTCLLCYCVIYLDAESNQLGILFSFFLPACLPIYLHLRQLFSAI